MACDPSPVGVASHDASSKIEWGSTQTSKGASVGEFDSGGFRLFRVPGESYPTAAGTQRAEAVADQRYWLPSDRSTQLRLRWKIHIPTIYTLRREFDWIVLVQIHQSYPNCPPNFELRIEQTRHQAVPFLVAVVGGGTLGKRECVSSEVEREVLGPLPTGEVFSVTLSGVWSSSSSRAKTRVYLNDRLSMDMEDVANLYEGMASYPKQGVYRTSSPAGFSVMQSGIERDP